MHTHLEVSFEQHVNKNVLKHWMNCNFKYFRITELQLSVDMAGHFNNNFYIFINLT